MRGQGRLLDSLGDAGREIRIDDVFRRALAVLRVVGENVSLEDEFDYREGVVVEDADGQFVAFDELFAQDDGMMGR